MHITEEQIKEIKKVISVVQLDSELKNAIKMSEIYKKANRDSYEISLLFFHAFNIIRNVDLDEVKELIQKAKTAGEKNGYFDDVILYPEYEKSGMKSLLSGKFTLRINANRDTIFDIIDLVFGRLLNEVKEGEDDLNSLLDGLK